MDLRWIYDSFFLRDVLAYIVPGAIVVLAIGLGLSPETVQGALSLTWPVTLGTGIPLAYAAGLALYHAATIARLSTSDHTTSILWIRPDRAVPAVDDTNRWLVLLRHPRRFLAWVCQYPSGIEYEKVLLAYYGEMAVRDTIKHLRAQVARQSLVKQVCGQFGVACLVLAVGTIFWPEPEHVSKHLESAVRALASRDGRILVLVVGLALWVGHLRHARCQAIMWSVFAERLSRDPNKDKDDESQSKDKK